MCAFCRKGWHERYPVESTLPGKASMELGVEWDGGRDMLTFNVYGSEGGSARFEIKYCPMCGTRIKEGE